MKYCLHGNARVLVCGTPDSQGVPSECATSLHCVFTFPLDCHGMHFSFVCLKTQFTNRFSDYWRPTLLSQLNFYVSKMFCLNYKSLHYLKSKR